MDIVKCKYCNVEGSKDSFRPVHGNSFECTDHNLCIMREIENDMAAWESRRVARSKTKPTLDELDMSVDRVRNRLGL
jgi:hypothetical protein